MKIVKDNLKFIWISVLVLACDVALDSSKGMHAPDNIGNKQNPLSNPCTIQAVPMPDNLSEIPSNELVKYFRICKDSEILSRICLEVSDRYLTSPKIKDNFLSGFCPFTSALNFDCKHYRINYTSQITEEKRSEIYKGIINRQSFIQSSEQIKINFYKFALHNGFENQIADDLDKKYLLENKIKESKPYYKYLLLSKFYYSTMNDKESSAEVLYKALHACKSFEEVCDCLNFVEKNFGTIKNIRVTDILEITKENSLAHIYNTF